VVAIEGFLVGFVKMFGWKVLAMHFVLVEVAVEFVEMLKLMVVEVHVEFVVKLFVAFVETVATVVVIAGRAFLDVFGLDGLVGKLKDLLMVI